VFLERNRPVLCLVPWHAYKPKFVDFPAKSTHTEASDRLMAEGMTIATFVTDGGRGNQKWQRKLVKTYKDYLKDNIGDVCDEVQEHREVPW
jgi:hypothetical protein